MLGVKLDTLYRYARRGEIDGIKLGKSWRFSEEDVQRFLDRHRYASGRTARPQPLLGEMLTRAAEEGDPSAGVFAQGKHHSYREINDAAERLAAFLHNCGVLPGDRVMVLLPNSLEFVVSVFGIWKLGGILVSEDVGIKAENLAHIVADSHPTALIIDHTVAERLESLGQAASQIRVVLVKDRTFTLGNLDQTRVESLEAALADFAPLRPLPPREGNLEDLVSISYTSGSTGRPKGVMHTHRSWLAGTSFTAAYHGVRRSDAIVIPLPPHHGLAFRQLLTYVQAQAKILLASDIYQALKLMKEHRPTALVMVPAAVNILLDHFAPLLPALNGVLRYLEIGSAALSMSRFEGLKRLLPNVAIHLPYGLTEARVGFLEAGPAGALNQIATTDPSLALRVLNEQGAQVQPGETGEIVLQGAGLMKGYWGSSDREQQQLQEAGFHTGDLAQLGADGKIALLGRRDDVLKVGGRKVNPMEIEAVLARMEALADSAVIAVPDPRGIFENQLHAFIVPRSRDSVPNEAELAAYCRKHLEPYKVPARFHVRSSLPKSAVGKTLKRSLTVPEETAIPQGDPR